MAEKKNIPGIRFKGFSEEWEECSLGEMAETFEYGLNAAATSYDGVNKYLRITDIDDETHEFKFDALTSPDTNLRIADNYKLKKGDLLFARTGASVGKTYYYKTSDGLVYFAGFLIRARIKPVHDVNFVFQNTLTYKYDKFIRLTSQRSGQPGVNAQEYGLFEIMTPKSQEQYRIGTYFQNLDKLISLNKCNYEKLVILKKAMLEKMFPNNGANVPEIRFKGFEEKWKEKKLGDIGSTYTGLSGKAKEDFGHGEGKYITYMNIFSNPVSNRDMTEPIEIDDYQNEVQFGDVFFTTSSETPEEVGMSSVWLENLKNVYLNSFCFGYRPALNIDSYFLAYILRSFTFRKRITFLAQGISRYNISKTKVMEIEISMPDMNEQIKIGKYFQNLDNLISLQQKKLEKLKNIKKACLEKMFV